MLRAGFPKIIFGTACSLHIRLLKHSVTELYLAIELPNNHHWHADQQISCAKYTGQTANQTNNYHSDIHEMSPLFPVFYNIVLRHYRE